MFSRNRPDRDDRSFYGQLLAGRGDRTEFHGVLIGLAVVTAIAVWLDGRHAIVPLTSSVGLFGIIFTTRRLHDFNQSGWWMLVLAAGFVAFGLAMARLPGGLALTTGLAALSGLVGVLFLAAMPGDAEPNRFGAPVRRRRRRVRAADAA